MAESPQNAFNSGELAPSLFFRFDLEQFSNGLESGENMILLPQGGARRRPGTAFLASFSTKPRLIKFKFNLEQQYLHVHTNLLLQIYQAGVKITQVVTPWTSAQIAVFDWDQSADTMVLVHEDVAPRVLRRLAMDGTGPIQTFNTSNVIHVRCLAHGLIDGNGIPGTDADEIGVSLVSGDVGGIPVAEINTSHTIAIINLALNADPLTVEAAPSKEQSVEITAHGLLVGERFELEGVVGFAGIPASEFNRIQKVNAVTDANNVTFLTESISTGASATGGGSAIIFSTPDKVAVTVSTSATSDASGGGSVAKTWALNSAETKGEDDPKNKLEFKNVSQFDFDDQLTGPRNNEKQRMIFTSPGQAWDTGEKYILSFRGSKTSKIRYDVTSANINAGRIQEGLRGLTRTSNDGIVVTPDTDSDGPGGAIDAYFVEFGGEEGGIQQPLIGIVAVTASAGILTVVELVEGGSTEEDSMSDVRGWPGTAAFFQNRLFFSGLKSRPSTLIGSKIGDPFNMDVGDALDSEAIDADGVFDPVIHLLALDRLFMFTGDSEFPITGGDAGITPETRGFGEGDTIGTTNVRPVGLQGRPIFVDRTERGVQQMQYDLDSDRTKATEITVFSPHLFAKGKEPVDMSVLRNQDGDYIYLVNADGDMAILSSNVQQGVLGWTPASTDGLFRAVAEVDDSMFVIVEREIGGTQFFLERFDETLFTDAGISSVDSAKSSWPGFGHLEGQSVAVRGEIDPAAGFATLDTVAVLSGSIVTSVSGAPEDVTGIEAGLAFFPELIPLPKSVKRKVRISQATLDLLDSRAVLVNGFQIQDRKFSDVFRNPPALLEGLFRMRTRGISDRATVTIAQTEPQPMTVRGLITELN